MAAASVACADFESPSQMVALVPVSHSTVAPSLRVLLKLEPDDWSGFLSMPRLPALSFSFGRTARSGREEGGGEGRLCHSSRLDDEVITIQYVSRLLCFGLRAPRGLRYRGQMRRVVGNTSKKQC